MKEKLPLDALAALLLVISGSIFGLSHLDPSWWLLAWIGMCLMVWGLLLTEHRGWLSLGILAGGFAGHWIGHPWYFDAVYRFGGGVWPLYKTGAAWLLINLSMVVPERLPLLLFLLTPLRQKIPVWFWFPLLWWGGEVLLFHFTGLVQAAFLYSQWQVGPVLKALGLLGWVPTTLLCLAACSVWAQGVYQRHWPRVVLAVVCPLLLFVSLPALPDNISALKGVGAVHMGTFGDFPRWSPELDLLIWPEVIRKGRLRVSEGLIQGLKDRPPLVSGQTYHLFGQETLTAAGEQNSMLAMAPDGTLLASRSKRLLFPGGERDIWGLRLPNRKLYLPGVLPATIDIAGRRVAPLLCYEEFDRPLALAAARDGATLLSVSAIEYSVGSTPEAASQFLGVSVLLAVETGLPVVRSSLLGPAALIAPNGNVIHQTEPGSSGILTLAGDWPAHIPRLNDRD